MRPKKSLGQNFLTSTTALKAIIRAAQSSYSPKESPLLVLEVGPGHGVLTRELLAAGLSVVAVEKDDALAEELRQTFAAEIATGQLSLVHNDILAFAPTFFLTAAAQNYQVVANIPYYLTGELLRLFLEADQPTGGQPKSMVLMLQKEVAERIVAKDGRESLLSLSIKAFGDPEYIQTVKAGSFFPKPKVDSAILAIKNISRERLGGLKPADFFQILHAGFAHKRKTLKNNLANWSNSTNAFATCTIDPKSRAENLTLNQWICLTQKLKNLSTNGN